MTLHTAKGLEFPAVFIIGMEDTVFPHANSMFDESGLEEERRLCYVGITRARERLYLTHAQSRNLFGSTHHNPPSRFIGEIPEEHIEAVGLGSQGIVGTGYGRRGAGDRGTGFGAGRGEGRVFGAGTPKREPTPAEERDSFEVGDSVEHKVFGVGEVLEIDGDKLTIAFRVGTKNLLAGYAPLRKLTT
jgi:DNA helicase-2/ATP-dependent DNA helicase PcrA